MIIYKILNPNTGEYTTVESTADIKALVEQYAMEFYLAHTHNSPVSQVTINEDGSETWSSFDVNTL